MLELDSFPRFPQQDFWKEVVVFKECLVGIFYKVRNYFTHLKNLLVKTIVNKAIVKIINLKPGIIIATFDIVWLEMFGEQLTYVIWNKVCHRLLSKLVINV